MQNPHRLPAHVRPERYKIMLKPDLENFIFEGEETIYLVLEKPTKQITLHSADLEIISAEWIHKTKEVWAGKISYNKEGETATFTFPKNLEPGKGELRLKFRGILTDKMRGFYRSKYTHEGVDKHLSVTQFEATDARRAFPCFDEPSQKAIFDVTLMIPSHTVAISNTIESSIKEHESGIKIVEFEPTPTMSTYLLAFIVGEFEYIEGKSGKGKAVRVFTTPGKKEQGSFALEVAIKCLDFYEEYFGIDYPLPVLDLIAIPDFASGAMENWGAVTYRESTLLIDEEKSSLGNKQWVGMVIAHELAHQWFGNLVTMEWWTHLWLNEGFASFIEYLAIDHIFPSWDIWTQFVSSEMGTAYSLDALKNTHPIEVEVGHPAEISEIFDKVSYSKGASILRMLHEYLGPKDFRDGLRHYLKKHSYSNAQTEDLWKSLEEVSGKPVSKVMRNWTSKPGHPVIIVVDSGKDLKLTQSRFFSSPISKKESKDKTVWSIPISTKYQNSSTKQILMDQKSIVIPDKGEKLNLGEASFVRVDYPHQYLKKLEKEVKSGKLSAPDRLGLIRDSFSLAQAGDSPTTLALELAQSYVDEEDYTVWAELTGQLSQLDSLLAYESFYNNYKIYNRYIYQRIAKKMAWNKKPHEKHTDALLRGMVLYKLGSYGDKETVEMAQKLWKSGEKVDPDLKGVVYNLVAENGAESEWSSLVKMYKEEDNQQEKDRLGRALGLFKNKTLLKKTLEFAISKHVRFQSALGIISSVWGNPKGRYLAWEFVKKNWKLLKERYAGGHYFTRVFGPATEFTKVSDARDIERFTTKNPIPEAKRTIAQALEQIYSNSEWLRRDRAAVKKFLEKFVPERI
ncbi:M1 family metallopeptidase [Candidatus Daviesbacteria bacterium]|nr:M1 family metallopeptidase [Candidatus Daviesbacteria bacterium]